MAVVDVIVVSYNSADTLRQCVSNLVADDGLQVIVVDNASQDESLASVADLPLRVVSLPTNCGFAFACNRGWEAGSAPHVLFLNPDARIDPASIAQLVSVLREKSSVGLVAPRVVNVDGTLQFSLRRFPRLRSTYAQALFLHRVFPRATWADEVIRNSLAYERRGTAEWVSGACVLVRRSTLEQIGGWDEGFFLYGEDIDICRRLWRSGFQVWFEPGALVVHAGGISAPRAQLLPKLAKSRVRYGKLHQGSVIGLLEQCGIALEALTHAALTSKGLAVRKGHLRAFWLLVRAPD
jgi:GT2 family glycosyltransferase